jgi:hypothetical protein
MQDKTDHRLREERGRLSPAGIAQPIRRTRLRAAEIYHRRPIRLACHGIGCRQSEPP